VGTLNSAYASLAVSDARAAGVAPEEESPFHLGESLAAAFATLSETTSSPTVSRRKLFATLP
jgi:hypothetical protein